MNMLDSMFGLQEGEQKPKIEEIQLIKLDCFPNQPFKLYSEQKLKELADDIQENGLLNPIIVRPMPNGRYQVIAGHNRLNAFMLNKEVLIPAIVKEMTDNEAKIALVNSNLHQRQEISPGEKAKAYKLRHEALKQQGKRNTGDTLAKLSETSGDSSRTISRYIKACDLSTGLFDRFSNNEFSVHVAEQLANLKEDDQIRLDDYIEMHKVKISTNHFSKLFAQSPLTDTYLDSIFKAKAKTKEKLSVIEAYDQYKRKNPISDVTLNEFENIAYYLKNMTIKWNA